MDKKKRRIAQGIDIAIIVTMVATTIFYALQLAV